MENTIHTLEDLRKQKQKIALEIKASEHLLSATVKEIPTVFQNKLVKQVILPLGLTATIGFGLKNVIDEIKTQEHSSLLNIATRVLPLLLSAYQAHQNEE
jgi:hypothetical protein